MRKYYFLGTRTALTSSSESSIIFSCWTKTLDLIERLLKSNNIRPLRIDGDSPLTQRQRTLDQFAKDGSARVMLMTTGTGAFG